ncbi:MAG: dihydrofolate reductase [Parcubacteria group bacterium]|nr:dihydrofolate reductase [Parcubacteria group bacterium]
MTVAPSTTTISLVVAMAENYVIGNGGKMPWGKKPVDGKRFYNLTVGKPVIMGRKTFESIGRELPKRTNIVLTRDKNFTASKCIIVHSVKEALAVAYSSFPFDKNLAKNSEIMVIGGAEIYKLFLPFANRIYLTLIFEAFAGDTFFPLRTVSEWIEWHSTNREYHEKGELCEYKMMFDLLVKIPSRTLAEIK